ncbi:nicotinate-nucleotide adenylyltransferase [Candidatus Omnitrophota bacterium]
MRIGILGGTFDPFHLGHLYLAKKVFKKLSLKKIIFIPAYLPPHKKNLNLATAAHRYNMARIAVTHSKGFEVSDIEIRRRGKSYSVETMRRLRKRYGDSAKLFFIAGSDSLNELAKWKNLKAMLELCEFVIVKRPHFGTGNTPPGFRLLNIGAKDISATEIRIRARKDLSINKMVPKGVSAYIKKHKLYLR